MRPSRVLKIYYLVTFAIGTLLTLPVAQLVQVQDVGPRGAALVTVCWNVLFVMLLPLVADWAEQRYCKARFMALEEVAKTNPELANVISSECKRLSIPGLRFAVVDKADELFSYGLWRNNPRLIMPGNYLDADTKTTIIPSVEAELGRFAKHRNDHTAIFLVFCLIQISLVFGFAYLILPK